MVAIKSIYTLSLVALASSAAIPDAQPEAQPEAEAAPFFFGKGKGEHGKGPGWGKGWGNHTTFSFPSKPTFSLPEFSEFPSFTGFPSFSIPSFPTTFSTKTIDWPHGWDKLTSVPPSAPTYHIKA